MIMKLKTQNCAKERSLDASKSSLLGSGGVDCLGPSKAHSRAQGGLGLEDDWELTGDFAHFSLSGLLALAWIFSNSLEMLKHPFARLKQQS